MSLGLILTIIFIALLTHSYLKYHRRFELGNRLPGPWAIPFIGNAQFATLTAETLFLKLNDLKNYHADCFRLWLGPKLWVFLHNPKDVEELLNNRDVVRADDFYHLKPLIGDGLLLLDGKRWFGRRKALSQAFHLRILEGFLPAFSHHSDIFVQNLPNSKSIEITDRVLLYVLDSICETSMGVEINSQQDPKCSYVKAFHDASHILFKRMSNPLLSFDFIFKLTPDFQTVTEAIRTLHSLTEKVIKDKRAFRESLEQTEQLLEDEFGIRRKRALLDVLMQCTIDGKPLSDQEIKDDVNTFLFAGIDTTKSAISFLLYNIAKHKKVQDQLFEEIVRILENNPSQDITANHLIKLTYLDKVVKESLRVHSTVPVTARQLTKETTIGHHTYPKDTTLWINIYGMAHDSRIFEDADQFIPERFETQNWIEKWGPYAYLPYSAGPRYCIGKKYSIFIIKTIVIKILLNYEIQLSNPNEKLILLAEMVLKSKAGINLRFEKRSLV